MINDTVPAYVRPRPESDKMIDVQNAISNSVHFADGMGPRPTTWCEVAELGDFIAHVLHLAALRFPDDDEARAEDAFDLATYWRPDCWPDSFFGMRDAVYRLALDTPARPVWSEIHRATERDELLSDARK